MYLAAEMAFAHVLIEHVACVVQVGRVLDGTLPLYKAFGMQAQAST